MSPLLDLRPAGLYCPGGDFYIDPWDPVERAVITHAHSDHACAGSQSYLTTPAGSQLLRARFGADLPVQTARYRERITLGDTAISLHPAGHILGSAQVRIESGGEVWVVSGDYKLAPDPTCEPFEPLRCHTFVTEATFALPIFRWPAEAQVIEDIVQWWRGNQQAGKISLLFAHPLGKAQRLLAGLTGSIYAHPSVEKYSQVYRGQGIALPETPPAGAVPRNALILAPPLAHNSDWARRFAPVSTALASGWMRIRGTRRRRSLDRGFVLSDHADWPALLGAIDETRAETIWVTHGHRAPLVRWLQEHGRQALAIPARFEGSEGAAS